MFLTKLKIQAQVHRKLVGAIDVVAGHHIMDPDVVAQGMVFQVSQSFEGTLGVVSQGVVEDEPTRLRTHRAALEPC